MLFMLLNALKYSASWTFCALQLKLISPSFDDLTVSILKTIAAPLINPNTEQLRIALKCVLLLQMKVAFWHFHQLNTWSFYAVNKQIVLLVLTMQWRDGLKENLACGNSKRKFFVLSGRFCIPRCTHERWSMAAIFVVKISLMLQKDVKKSNIPARSWWWGQWSRDQRDVLVDKGYQKIAYSVRSVRPTKKILIGCLDLSNGCWNEDTSKVWIIVESFLRIQNAIFGTMSVWLTWDENPYDLIPSICCALRYIFMYTYFFYDLRTVTQSETYRNSIHA